MTRDRKPPRQPLFWAALIFSAGLWTGARAWRPPSWWAVALVAFVLAATFFLAKRAWLAKGLALGAWFLAGALLIQIHNSPTTDPRLSEVTDGRAVMLTGHIIREGYAHDASPGATRQSIDVETEEIGSEGVSWPIKTGVRLTIHDKLADLMERGGSLPGQDGEPTLTLTYGTRLRMRAKLHDARNYRNPGAFDYEGYLRENGISLLGSAEAKDVEPLPGFSGSRIERWRTRVHGSIIAKIHQLWPASQASLMDAMVLGENHSEPSALCFGHSLNVVQNPLGGVT